MATTRSLNCWWYVQRGKEGGNVRICRTRRGCGGGKMSGIDRHLYRHVYGYMCLFLSLYRMFVKDTFYTWTYPLFCVDTYVYTYTLVHCRQIVKGICPSLQFGRDLVETPKRLSTCVCMSLYRYISYIPAYTYTRTYVQPCQYACLPLCRVVDHGGCEYIDM